MAARPLSSFPLPNGFLQKLSAAGFELDVDLREMRPAQLAKELDMNASDALRVLKLIRGEPDSISAVASFSTSSTSSNGASALEIYRQSKEQPILITMCEELDQALGGGINVEQLTEFYGVPGIGKTQFGMQLACDVQIPSFFGGLQGQAVYIDTEGSFMPERAAEIAQAVVKHLQLMVDYRHSDLDAEKRAFVKAMSEESVLSNIFVFRVYDHAEQVACIKMLPQFLQDHPHVKLIVLDSVAFHFRTEFENYAARQRMLQGLSQDLLAMADKHKLAVVLMNQVTTKVDSSGGQLVAALGESWAHVCTTRISLYWQGDQRWARLVKSPSRREVAVPFDISLRGVRKRAAAQKRKSGAMAASASTSASASASTSSASASTSASASATSSAAAGASATASVPPSTTTSPSSISAQAK